MSSSAVRWTGRSLAGLIGIVLVAYPFALAVPSQRLVLLALVALVMMGGALTRPGGALPIVAVAFMGMEYGAALMDGGLGLDPLSPVIAVLLFTFLEALDLAGSSRSSAQFEQRVVLDRVLWSLSTAVGGGLVAGLALLAGAATAVSTVAASVVAAACLYAAISLPLWWSRPSLKPQRRGAAELRPERSSGTSSGAAGT
jgi:hypothetical protein